MKYELRWAAEVEFDEAGVLARVGAWDHENLVFGTDSEAELDEALESGLLEGSTSGPMLVVFEEGVVASNPGIAMPLAEDVGTWKPLGDLLA